ncbi:MAG: M4 family metallopeptidase [Deltaproteobacteria bacterium]|nr:M4 family metallopeptidase [Deltaproteobacteria bacterium]
MRCARVRSIIPPHMVEEIAKNGPPGEAARALQNLSAAAYLRGVREASGLLARGAPVGYLQRTVYDNHGAGDRPPSGTIARRENDPSAGDSAVDEAFEGAGATYKLYLEVYERNSIDGRGMPIVSYVHYEEGLDNAFWDGTEMIYGDGDGVYFDRFTKAIDVIGHELTHGVTQYEANFIYRGQSGALNESMSDVFGSLVKQRVKKQRADQADWLIGEGLFTSKVKGKALRSMKAPGTAYNDPVLGKDPQPDNMAKYVKTQSDNGGVHINSGIPNHAFYLAAMDIGGYAWEKAGRIWYIALRDRLKSRATFTTAAKAIGSVAKELFGDGSLEHKAVLKAWKQVGVLK